MNGFAAKGVHGTTEGLVDVNPKWSAGLQLGNYAGTGVSAQRVGFAGGALNFALGVNGGTAVVTADYIYLFTDEFQPIPQGRSTTYNQLRGQLQPYVGGGIAAGDGLSLRVPFGLQYAMLRDPVNYYGGIALMVGPYLSGADSGLKAWFNLGARLML